MALTLQEMEIPARSWQGWQVPVRTSSAHSSARIEEIPTENIINKFNEGMRVAVVAGFQGTNTDHPPLVDLSDVNKAGLNDNDVLVYDQDAGKFVAMDITTVNDNDGGEF